MKKAITIGLVVCIVISFAIVSASALSNSGGGTWQYEKEITIREKSDKLLTNYQILVELSSSDFPIEAQSDGDDIRFTNADGTELSYWIEGWNAKREEAKVWVKIPRIPASGKTEIIMHYGNPSASSSSDGDATFKFFDDFEGRTVDTNKWYLMSGGATIKYGILTSSNINLRSKKYYGVNYALKYNAVHGDGNANWIGFIVDGGRPFVIVEKHSWCGWIFHNCLSGNKNYGKSLPSNYLNTWHTYEIIRDGITSTILYLDNSKAKYAKLSQQTTANNLPITIWSEAAGSVQVDWIFIRNYISPEPTVSKPIQKMPSLAISKTVFPSTLQEDDTTTITIEIKNKGSVDVKNIEITDSFPTEFTLVSGSMNHSYDAIKPNEWRSYQYSIKATEAGGFETDVASITYEDEKGNAYSSASNLVMITVVPETTPMPAPATAPELILTKSANPPTINELENTTITLKVENIGTADAKNIEVNDSIPVEFTLVSGSINHSYSTLKPNEWRTYQYTIKATETGRFETDVASTTYEDEEGNFYSSTSNPVITVEPKTTPTSNNLSVTLSQLQHP